jgi:hypothetical protein
LPCLEIPGYKRLLPLDQEEGVREVKEFLEGKVGDGPRQLLPLIENHVGYGAGVMHGQMLT